MVKNRTLTCPICLSKITRPAHLNSCLHAYCYKCIKKWSKYKTSCPLCLSNFTLITHRPRRFRKQARPFQYIKLMNTPKKMKKKQKKQATLQKDMDMQVQEEIFRIFESPNTRGSTQRVLNVISMIQNLLLEI